MIKRVLLIAPLAFLSSTSWAAKTCTQVLEKHLAGAQFLHLKNPNLHQIKDIQSNVQRDNPYSLNASSPPVKKISAWLDHLENTHFRYLTNPTYKNKLKNSYFRQLIIKAYDVPETYFELQERIHREQGQDPIDFSNAMKADAIKRIIAEQKHSLGIWLDYFLSKDSEMYPMWAKYWSFSGLTKLGRFDKETQRFTKRTRSTIAPFPELNREALAEVMDVVLKKVSEATLEGAENPQLLRSLASADFGTLYAEALARLEAPRREHSTTEGYWVKYPRGSDHRVLYEALKGKNTGWCTAGASTAKSHLTDGDFYVYFSQNLKGKSPDPRIAIRLKDSKIKEVRGVGPSQNLDSAMEKTDILKIKLAEFGAEGTRYLKATEHMKRLTEIDRKDRKKIPLTREDLRFIYEIDEPIINFGYGPDPRVAEIQYKRDIRKDLSFVLDLPENKISLTEEEALSGSIVYHFGDLILRYLDSAENLNLPEIVGGNLDLGHLKMAHNLKLSRRVNGDVNLSNLEHFENLLLPDFVLGNFDIRSIEVGKGLELPQYVGGDLDLFSLALASGLTFPETVGRDIYLLNLESVKGLSLSNSVGGSIYIGAVKSSEKIKPPSTLGGKILIGNE